MSTVRNLLLVLLASSSCSALAAPAADGAADAAVPAAAEGSAAAEEDNAIVVTGRVTRSVSTLEGPEIQKILPGVSPLKAIQTLPGVTFLTADPWGNNEQNISLFIHGFNQQQLGYTLDGVPLGDQTYGNYNGLSPQRAVISENVGRVNLATGAGDLRTPSTSNLGGTIDTFSSDPAADFGLRAAQTFGSHSTSRTFLRLDSGDIGGNTRLYVSGVRQYAKAWDFDGEQKGWQANAKLVHEGEAGKLTAYFAFSDKKEPNEDATVVSATQTYQPYTRPFLYPNFADMQAYLANRLPYNGAASYQAAGSNFSNYYSAALRRDYLGYLRYEAKLSDNVTWTNTGYYHHNSGVGIVAGPITAAGLPNLFSYYFPGPQGPGVATTSPANIARLSGIFGGSGLATRTTEYRIERFGGISILAATFGDHDVEVGGWYERQRSSAYRRWYALDAANPSSPYRRPENYADPLITQYGSQVRVNEYQYHLQDAWHITPAITLQAGFKGAIQEASQQVPVQPIPGSFTGSQALPVGKITTKRWFLPQVGGVWEVSEGAQAFFNVQKNMRQFQTSAAAGLSPFALGNQALFELFKDGIKPETSWTYEAGARLRRQVDLGPLTAIEGQISYYHVDFSDRLLAISPNPTITAIISGANILQNVGDVKTDGIDFAATLRFGQTFSLYNALSYNRSIYKDDYITGASNVVRTAGKKVPGSPDWLNKTVATLNIAPVEVQLVGDYLGKRYATFTNDLSVGGYFTMSGRIAVEVPLSPTSRIRRLTAALNVTNITNKRAASTLSIGAASGTYNFFPVAERQAFVTVSAAF